MSDDAPVHAGLRIDALREEDFEAVAALGALSFEHAWSADEVRAEAIRDIALARVARRDGRILGYALAWIVVDEGELHTIAVHPDARGRGIGRALLADLLACAEARGAARIHLEVRADNAAAVALYTRAGFVETGRRARYYADGVDARLMTRATTSAAP